MDASKKHIVRYIYLYLVTAITIVVLLISTIGMLNIALKEFVLDVKSWEEMDEPWMCSDDYIQGEKGMGFNEMNKIDNEDFDKEACTIKEMNKIEARHINDIKRDFSNFLAMMIISLPLYLYHWGIVRKEK